MIKYLIVLTVLLAGMLMFSCSSISKLKPSKQKESSDLVQPDKTAKKVPAPLKKAYKYYYVMFLAMCTIGVIMLVLGIKSLNKDYIVGGGSLLALGILGPVLIYLALIALKIIMWVVGIAFFGTIAYIIYYMNKVRNTSDSHVEHLVQSFEDYKYGTWDKDSSKEAKMNTPEDLHDKIQKIKGKF